MIPRIRLRDFIEDTHGWIYSVATYDNEERVGCVLRYIPDPGGERADRQGIRYKKFDFEEAYAFIAERKPHYAGSVHRIPLADVRRVFKPEVEIPQIAASHQRVAMLMEILGVPAGFIGCTGSLLIGLDNEASDIDIVVYGPAWFSAQETLRKAIQDGRVEDLSDEMWEKVYRKRRPEISFEDFVLHERRKWNRGQIGGTYFDLLFSRSYEELDRIVIRKGEVLRRATITARVTDASLGFDSPAVYEVEHEEITRVLSFTHTYSGQALAGETIEACGVVERHGSERWLIVGTTREARGEYIVSRTLLEE
jgi:predicted nucleotidyltransferase